MISYISDKIYFQKFIIKNFVLKKFPAIPYMEALYIVGTHCKLMIIW